MKKLIVCLMLIGVLLVGCGNNHEDFVKESGDLYVQMLIDGEQSTKVNEMYADFIDSYESSYGDEDLFKAVRGMYEGLENGNATKYQIEVMRILDAN